MSHKSFWFSFTVAAVLACSATSFAKWRRIHAATCDGPEGTYATIEGVWNGQNNSAFVACPIPEDDLFSKTEITILNVHGHDRNAGVAVQAAACRIEFNSQTYECGTPATGSVAGTASYTLYPSRSAWSTAAGAPFVAVWLPGNSNTLPSSVRAIYVSN